MFKKLFKKEALTMRDIVNAMDLVTKMGVNLKHTDGFLQINADAIEFDIFAILRVNNGAIKLFEDNHGYCFELGSSDDMDKPLGLYPEYEKEVRKALTRLNKLVQVA